MGAVVKKCLACGTINPYMSKSCKQCNSPLLADVDQADEIMSMDPMEAAVNDAVASVDGEDDMVAQILREQAMKAKQIVEKENEKEARKQKQQKKEVNNAPFSRDPVSSTGRGFSLGGEGRSSSGKNMGGLSSGTTYGGLDGSEREASSKYGFKIAAESDGPVVSRHMSASDEAAATWSRTTNGPKKNQNQNEEQNNKWKMKKPEE